MERRSRDIAPSWLAPAIAGCGGLFVLALGLATVAGVALVWLRFATATPAPAYRGSPGAPLPPPIYLPPPPAPIAPVAPIAPAPPVDEDPGGRLDIEVRVSEARGRARVREGAVCRLALDIAQDDDDDTLRCSGTFSCGARSLWEVDASDAFACDVSADTGLVVAHDDASGASRPALTATYAHGDARVTLYRGGPRFLFVSASSDD